MKKTYDNWFFKSRKTIFFYTELLFGVGGFLIFSFEDAWSWDGFVNNVKESWYLLFLWLWGGACLAYWFLCKKLDHEATTKQQSNGEAENPNAKELKP